MSEGAHRKCCEIERVFAKPTGYDSQLFVTIECFIETLPALGGDSCLDLF